MNSEYVANMILKKEDQRNVVDCKSGCTTHRACFPSSDLQSPKADSGYRCPPARPCSRRLNI